MEKNRPTRIAIVGSRSYRSLERVAQYVRNLPQETVVVSGGAHGVDATAEYAARCRHMQALIFLPNWRKYGRSAGMLRNQLIVDNADKLVAFWDGKSRGTRNSISLAQIRGIPIEVYSEDGGLHDL